MNGPAFNYWEQHAYLDGIDTIVVGGGITGVTAAIALGQSEPKMRIAILDTYPIIKGASTRNAGFACFGSPSELLADMRNNGMDDTMDTLYDRIDGLQLLRSYVDDQKIDFRLTQGHEWFFIEDRERYDQCLEQLEGWNTKLKERYGWKDTYYPNHHAIPDKVISIRQEGQLHPGKLMYQLRLITQSLGIYWFEGISMIDYEEYEQGVRVQTNLGTIHTGRLLVATNGFTQKISDTVTVCPARNQVLLTQPIKAMPLAPGTYHYDEGYVYWRNVENRILVGGMRQLAMESEMTDQFGCTDQIIGHLTEFLSTRILGHTDWKVDQTWSGIMGVGKTKAPIIQKTGERVIFAVKLGGMGIAIGALVGKKASQMLRSL